MIRFLLISTPERFSSTKDGLAPSTFFNYSSAKVTTLLMDASLFFSFFQVIWSAAPFVYLLCKI